MIQMGLKEWRLVWGGEGLFGSDGIRQREGLSLILALSKRGDGLERQCPFC